MNWDEFTERSNARRLRSQQKQERRAMITAWVVLVLSCLLAWYVIIVAVWGVMK